MRTLGLFFLILLVLSLVLPKSDDTDKGFFDRSGISLYTDNKTGLQYIRAGIFGNLIPRLDENGKQMRKSK